MIFTPISPESTGGEFDFQPLPPLLVGEGDRVSGGVVIITNYALRITNYALRIPIIHIYYNEIIPLKLSVFKGEAFILIFKRAKNDFLNKIY